MSNSKMPFAYGECSGPAIRHLGDGRAHEVESVSRRDEPHARTFSAALDDVDPRLVNADPDAGRERRRENSKLLCKVGKVGAPRVGAREDVAVVVARGHAPCRQSRAEPARVSEER